MIRGMYEARFNLDIETDSDEIAYQIGVISREGTQRIIDYAFRLADSRPKKHLSSVDKANVLTDIYGLWREIFTGSRKEIPGREDRLQPRRRLLHVVRQEPRVLRRDRHRPTCSATSSPTWRP